MMSPCSSSSTVSLGFAAFKQKRDKINIFSAPFNTSECKKMPPAAFFTPAEFYKTLLASAVLQQQHQRHQPNKQFHYTQDEECTKVPTSTFRCKFFLPHLQAGANKAATKTKPQNAWSSNVSTDGGNNDLISNNNNNNSTSILSPSATNTSTPPDSTAHLGLSGNFGENRKTTPISSPTDKQREGQSENCTKSNNNKPDLLTHGFLQQCSSSTMPIGGVQSQNPSQGLVHWMSVMAEHMSGQSHHDPTPVGMHAYMWNGNVDVSKI